MFFVFANQSVFEGVNVDVCDGGVGQGLAKLDDGFLEAAVERLGQVIEGSGTSVLVVV